MQILSPKTDLANMNHYIEHNQKNHLGHRLIYTIQILSNLTTTNSNCQQGHHLDKAKRKHQRVTACHRRIFTLIHGTCRTTVPIHSNRRMYPLPERHMT